MMRDYKELVERLRSVKDTWQSEEEQWMLDAADAIEELLPSTQPDVPDINVVNIYAVAE